MSTLHLFLEKEAYKLHQSTHRDPRRDAWNRRAGQLMMHFQGGRWCMWPEDDELDREITYYPAAEFMRRHPEAQDVLLAIQDGGSIDCDRGENVMGMTAVNMAAIQAEIKSRWSRRQLIEAQYESDIDFLAKTGRYTDAEIEHARSRLFAEIAGSGRGDHQSAAYALRGKG